MNCGIEGIIVACLIKKSGFQMTRFSLISAVTGFFILCDVSAQASDLNAGSPHSTPYEVRVSGFAHGVLLGGMDERGSADIGGSLIFPIFDAKALSHLSFLIPRAQLGTTVNLASETSFVYGGLSWKALITEKYFVTFDFGGALNNGEEMGAPGRAAMGCHEGFREALGLGRQLSDVWSVSASIEHFSNAGLCEKNDGITNIGLTLGYDF